MTEWNKAIVALVISVLTLIELYTGWSSELLSETALLAVLAILSPILVYFVPNRPRVLT